MRKIKKSSVTDDDGEEDLELTETNAENAMIPGDRIGLAGLCEDPNIEKDAMFLVAMVTLLQTHETSLQTETSVYYQ